MFSLFAQYLFLIYKRQSSSINRSADRRSEGSPGYWCMGFNPGAAACRWIQNKLECFRFVIPTEAGIRYVWIKLNPVNFGFRRSDETDGKHAW